MKLSRDIPLLAAHFIMLQNQKFKTAIRKFDSEALKILCAYEWPGNIRQLKNVVEACMAIESGESISCETLTQFIEIADGTGAKPGVSVRLAPDVPYTTALEQFEADLLNGLLKRHGGNIDAAAREAGMNVVTMYRKIKRYGISKTGS